MIEKIISGKQLHEMLDIKEKYSEWIKQQIDELYLVKNVDYVIWQYDYKLTRNAAIKICEHQGTGAGRITRQVLIFCL